MSEFDRGVRASIVAHDMFYGVGQAVGLGLRQHRLGQAALINALRCENEALRTHLDLALNNGALWENCAAEMEADRDYCNALFKNRTAEYNKLVDEYNLLLQQKNEWIAYANRLKEALADPVDP